MGLTDAEVIPLVMAQAERTNTLWNYYILVVTGIVAALATDKLNTTSSWIKLAIVAVFCVFAFGNWNAIIDAGEVRAQLLSKLSADNAGLASGLAPSTWCEYTAFHAMLDGLVVLFVAVADRPARKTVG